MTLCLRTTAPSGPSVSESESESVGSPSRIRTSLSPSTIQLHLYITGNVYRFPGQGLCSGSQAHPLPRAGQAHVQRPHPHPTLKSLAADACAETSVHTLLFSAFDTLTCTKINSQTRRDPPPIRRPSEPSSSESLVPCLRCPRDRPSHSHLQFPPATPSQRVDILCTLIH